jgi:hypothetical protein
MKHQCPSHQKDNSKADTNPVRQAEDGVAKSVMGLS